MYDETPDNLPATVDSDEVEVSVQPGGLVVAGDPEAVEAYLTRLRIVAGKTMRVAGIDKSSVANAAGLTAGIAGLLAESGKYVQLHPDSINALRVGKRPC